jgi:succinate dehydrogenase/fumarate reductase flavoprotein subunit
MPTAARPDSPVHDIELSADVLVIGGGPAGAWAALSAADEGASVVVVEKGYTGTSGPFGVGAGTGIYYARPDDAEQRDTIVQSRQPIAYGLSDPAWGYRTYDQAYVNLEKIAKWGFDWPRTPDGAQEWRGNVRGPTIMAFLRKVMLAHGVRILDHSPALELLAADGVAAGASGVNKQTGQTWQVRAGAVVITTGGTSFLSGVLGDKTHTGDGYLLAAELGAEFSGMELTGQWQAAPKATNLTRGAYRSEVGTYYDANGEETKNGRQMVNSILELGPELWDSLDRTGGDLELQKLIRDSHPIAFQYFERKGIDPFTERYPVTFLLEGTMRAGGGLAIDDDLATSVPGLFAGGDCTSREKLSGGGPPGGGPAQAWAFATGAFAGQSAARFALQHGQQAAYRQVVSAGRFGVQHQPDRAVSPEEIIELVQDEMLVPEKNYWRTGPGMTASLQRFDDAWTHAIPQLGWVTRDSAKATARDRMRTREAAALLATGRWIYASALMREESRGLHRRKDFPGPAADWEGQHVLSGGLDRVWVRQVPHVNTLGELKLALQAA